MSRQFTAMAILILESQGKLSGLNGAANLVAKINAYDLVFVLTAIAFNLLIAALFVAVRNGWSRAARVTGVLWLLLAVPFAVVFVGFLAEGKSLRTLVPLSLVLLYMLVEFLLDYVFKFDFRCRWITHVPYIVLEYTALFSLVGIAFSINRTCGYLVSIPFWILMASLIYLYWGKKRTQQRVTG